VLHDNVTCHSVTSHKIKSHNNYGKVVHRPCSSCISSIQEIHKNSIKFSLSSADKGAVGFILAQKLAILTETFRREELPGRFITRKLFR